MAPWCNLKSVFSSRIDPSQFVPWLVPSRLRWSTSREGDVA